MFLIRPAVFGGTRQKVFANCAQSGAGFPIAPPGWDRRQYRLIFHANFAKFYLRLRDVYEFVQLHA